MTVHPAKRPGLDAAGLSALLRPRIALLVLVITAAGYVLQRPDDYTALPWTLLGTLLVAAAGCALNHFLERRTDALMARTAGRPLCTGALSERQVSWGGGLVMWVGFVILAWGAGWPATLWQLLAIVTYLVVYTPLKKRTSVNTWVGALPGALPVIVGAAAAGGPGALSWVVFTLVFLWQLPHFFAIASMYREDYVSGGLRMLSGDDPGDRLLRWQMPMQVMSVMLVSVIPVLLGLARASYGLVALGVGLVFFLAALSFRRRPDRTRARQVVLASVVYLPVVMAALIVDVACHDQTLVDGTGLPNHGELPDFSLVGEDGRPFGKEQLLGSVWVVDFIFTHCAGPCPIMSQVFAQLGREDLPTRFLSITVDPRRDSPAVLAGYRQRYGGHADVWRLLTGGRQAIQLLAEQGFRLPVNAGVETVTGMPPMFHSGKFALVDVAGRVRGYYDSRDQLALQRLREHVRLLAAAAR